MMFNFKVGDKVRTTKGDREMMRGGNGLRTSDLTIKIIETGRKWGKKYGNVYDAVVGVKMLNGEVLGKPHVYLVKNLRIV